MKTPSSKTILSVVALVAVVAGLQHFAYKKKIYLYQLRLRETLTMVHELQHELDPTHERFNHGQEKEVEEDHSGHEEHEGHDGHDHGHHNHDAPIDITALNWRPTIRLHVEEDAVSGFNVHLETEQFEFSPHRASGTHIDGEGHAHLYVNDVKVARVYGNWFHLGSLPSGTNTVRVDLNGNDHRPFLVSGSKIEDNVEVVVD